MSVHENELGQAVGPPVPGWVPRPRPRPQVMQGRWCRLEPLSAAAHAAALFAAYGEDRARWTYLPYGPFESAEEYASWVRSMENRDDPVCYSISGNEHPQPLGVAAYLRIQPEMGSIEVGHVHYAARLQKTPAATEAMFLMMRHAFGDLGYRRYEWKCDSLNEASRAAAQRLGFRYEGTFRQAMVMKGRNRDTAWFSITDREWPRIKTALERWLEPSNFDSAGQQRRRVQALRQEAGR